MPVFRRIYPLFSVQVALYSISFSACGALRETEYAANHNAATSSDQFAVLCKGLNLGALSEQVTTRQAIESLVGASIEESTVDDIWSELRTKAESKQAGLMAAIMYRTRGIQEASVRFPRPIIATGNGLLAATSVTARELENDGDHGGNDGIELIDVRCDLAARRVRFAPFFIGKEANGKAKLYESEDSVPPQVLHGFDALKARLSKKNIVLDIPSFPNLGQACAFCHHDTPNFVPIFEEYDIWPGALLSEQGARFAASKKYPSIQLDDAYMQAFNAWMEKDPNIYSPYGTIVQSTFEKREMPDTPIEQLSSAIYNATVLNLAQAFEEWRSGFKGSQLSALDAAMSWLLIQLIFPDERSEIIQTTGVASQFAETNLKCLDSLEAGSKDKQTRMLEGLEYLKEELVKTSPNDGSTLAQLDIFIKTNDATTYGADNRGIWAPFYALLLEVPNGSGIRFPSLSDFSPSIQRTPPSLTPEIGIHDRHRQFLNYLKALRAPCN